MHSPKRMLPIAALCLYLINIGSVSAGSFEVQMLTKTPMAAIKQGQTIDEETSIFLPEGASMSLIFKQNHRSATKTCFGFYEGSINNCPTEPKQNKARKLTAPFSTMVPGGTRGDNLEDE